MSAAAAQVPAGHKPEKHVPVMLFLLFTPVLGIAGTAAWTWYRGFEMWMLVLALTMYVVVGLSITAGYHRYYSHKSYEASPAVQAFFAVFGAMAAQNSALTWSASHRVHHQHVDKDWDPYNIKRGFWWAHILWVFHRHETPSPETYAPDLLKNPIAVWQHRWYKHLLIIAGFALPTLVGAMFGDPIAGLLWGGFLRLTVIHHTTFFVNSLAHYVGRRTFDETVSARDNWAVALVTMGEGYHSFHHRFPSDYRNGIRWYHWDPGKWLISTLKAVGLASDLRSVPPPQIEMARLTSEERRIASRLSDYDTPASSQVQQLFSDARKNLESAIALWRTEVTDPIRHSTLRRETRKYIRNARRGWKDAARLARGSVIQTQKQ